MRQAFAQQRTGVALIPAQHQRRRLRWRCVAEQGRAVLAGSGRARLVEQAQLQLAAQVRQQRAVLPLEAVRMRGLQARADPVGMFVQETVDLPLRQEQGRVDHDLASFGNAQRQASSPTAAAQDVGRMYTRKGSGFPGTGGETG